MAETSRAHRRPTGIAAPKTRRRRRAAIIIACLVVWALAAGYLLWAWANTQLPGQTDETTTRDFAGHVIDKPAPIVASKSSKPAEGQSANVVDTPLNKPVDPPADAVPTTQSGGHGGLSIPAIGMMHMPLRTMDVSADWSVNPPDNDSWWVAVDPVISPGFTNGGHGRILVAAHSSMMPGVVAGNLIMGQGGGSHPVSRATQVGDVIEFGDKPLRFKVDGIHIANRDTVMRSELFANANGLVLITCDRRNDESGDWRYQPYPQMNFVVTATLIE